MPWAEPGASPHRAQSQKTYKLHPEAEGKTGQTQEKHIQAGMGEKREGIVPFLARRQFVALHNE